MAKLTSGIKTINSTKFQTTNGRTFRNAAAANEVQSQINARVNRRKFNDFLITSGINFPSSTNMFSTKALGIALKSPRFVAKLQQLASAAR